MPTKPSIERATKILKPNMKECPECSDYTDDVSEHMNCPVYNYVAEEDKLINHIAEVLDEYLSLIDGAYEVVERSGADTNSIAYIEWKKNWLANAREKGASGE